jgi:hypothetical protein
MPNTTTTVLVTIALIVFILLSISMLLNSRKWKCSSEGGCELAFGGGFTSKVMCERSCGNKPSNKFSCSNDGTCVQSPQGTFDTLSACQAGCTAPTTTYVYPSYPSYPYYPQSLIYPIYNEYRRPWYRRWWRQ